MKQSLLIRKASLLRVVVLSSLLAAPYSLPPRGGAAEPSSEQQIERWIEELGSDRFDVREAATRELKKRVEAATVLHKALSSPDAEVRRRATRILEMLKSQRADRALTRAYVLGQMGQIVETVDRLVYWREWDKDEEGWETLTRFADKLMDRAAKDLPPIKREMWKRPGLPAGDFRRYYEAKGSNPNEKPPKEISGRKIVNTRAAKILARGEQVILKMDMDSVPSIAFSIVAASEDVLINHAMYSLIVAGGDIKANSLRESILVCDGDVELLEPPRGGLIVARGKVTCRNRELTGCIVRSENYYQFLDGKRIIIKDGTPDPLGGFVKFFEFSDVGLTVSDHDQKEEPLQNGVRLKDVRKDSPFASGLRAGDVVTALDGTKATSPEVFRRLLRRKLGQGDPSLTFTVRRSGKTLDVPIPIKD
jgi:hypothetical protein